MVSTIAVRFPQGLNFLFQPLGILDTDKPHSADGDTARIVVALNVLGKKHTTGTAMSAAIPVSSLPLQRAKLANGLADRGE